MFSDTRDSWLEIAAKIGQNVCRKQCRVAEATGNIAHNVFRRKFRRFRRTTPDSGLVQRRANRRCAVLSRSGQRPNGARLGAGLDRCLIAQMFPNFPDGQPEASFLAHPPLAPPSQSLLLQRKTACPSRSPQEQQAHPSEMDKCLAMPE